MASTITEALTEISTTHHQNPGTGIQPNLAGIVLAAGRASRFGSDKRKARYNDQHTLLSRAINVVLGYCSQVVVVTRPGDDDAGAELMGVYQDHPKVEQFIANDAPHGMGASLSNGVTRVIAREQQLAEPFSGVLIMLADMPFVREQTIAQLIKGYAADKIAIPCYLQAYKEKKWGNPVLFSRKWFPALQGLHGDRGAKSLIKANPCARVEVVVDDPGILRDIDTPEDLMT